MNAFDYASIAPRRRNGKFLSKNEINAWVAEQEALDAERRLAADLEPSGMLDALVNTETVTTTEVVVKRGRGRPRIVRPENPASVLWRFVNETVDADGVLFDGEPTFVCLYHEGRGRPDRETIVDFLTRSGDIARVTDLSLDLGHSLRNSRARVIRHTMTAQRASALVALLRENGVKCDTYTPTPPNVDPMGEVA